MYRVGVAAALSILTACALAAAAAGDGWRVERERGGDHVAARGEVTYDGRALVVNGTRRMLFSGEIHYTRSTPEMWPKLIAKARRGGLDVIQTYVFWNVHEPVQGQFNFEGRYDIVKFIREIQAQGLYVSLRIGPFIEAEWKYGGFPFWLHDVPNITFRTDNEPFKQHMQRFVTQIVNMMKHEGLYYPQGGPIVISQIENEYQMVEPAFGPSGQSYVRWAAQMAVGLQTGVPWMMCKQDDAPDPIINTCNGLICGETFVGPNSPSKPALWTENWTTRYPIYGNDTKLRSTEDIAFALALFIARKRGSFVSYYMYHGGTNFGRSASSYVTTSYYDGAPLDEYGLIWRPTWGHLRELHAAVKQSSEPLLFGRYSNFSLGQEQEAHVFETELKCVAFLVNFDKHQTPTVVFRNISFQLAPKSISIVSDCRTTVFETAKVNAQRGSRTAEVVQSLSDIHTWKAFKEPIPQDISKAAYTGDQLFEHLSTTKDETDYLWYIVSYEYRQSDDSQLVLLNVESRAHILHAFVNREFVGSVHGSHDARGNIILNANISLKEGQNTIALLSVMVGSPDSGAHMENRSFGIRKVSIQQGQQPLHFLDNELWGYQVGLFGEGNRIYTQEGSYSVEWRDIYNLAYLPLTWYQTTFATPTSDDAVTLNLTSMGKGEVWVNGESIGRGFRFSQHIDSGAHMENRSFGIRKVSIQQGQQPLHFLDNELWGYQVGLFGEGNRIYTQEGSYSVEWRDIYNLAYLPLTWYQTTFATPTSDDAVTLNLTSMGKGEVWVNGESIGRYWVSFKTPSGQPSQSLYHIPQHFLKPRDNLLVLVEEIGGDPLHITVNTVSITTVCGNVNEFSAPALHTQGREPEVRLRCQRGKHISAIEFASYGNPAGDCTAFSIGSCHAESSEAVVEQACIGKRGCSIPVSPAKFGANPCPGIQKSLAVVANCR